DPRERKRMAVVESGGRSARTKFRRLDKFLGPLSLFEAELFTGRTHQIRVHFSSHAFPLAGDPVYTNAGRAGRRNKEIAMQALAKKAPEAFRVMQDFLETGRQFLHAAHLGFIHPVTGASLNFDSELPADLKSVVVSLSACQEP
ncbi:MAG: RNA pseudouridine synthase, partial [Proteobacteria bacterium]